jgi:hypothetical protein
MALTATALYNAAIANPHERATRIRVFHGTEDVTPAGGLPIVDGTVHAALSSRVTRSLDLEVPHEYFPHNPTDLLSPYRATVLVETGIRYPNGSVELFPVFRGRIYQATLNGDGAALLRADDLAADVLAYRFEQPEPAQAGISTIDQMRILISQAIDNATFGPNDVDDATVPELVWDDDRGKAMDDLASSLRGRWYALGNGDFVVREFPYLTSTPVVDLTDGPQGIVVSASKTVTRDATANSITVISERVDGSEPITATRRDGAIASPTYFGGLFGKVSQILKPQTPLTAAGADQLALRTLEASLALTEQWSVSMVPLHWLEPGDTVGINYRGVSAEQVIDSMTIPLTTRGSMSLRTRSSVPGVTADGA